jgi:ABC-2 type transport system ATP-binding protein
VGKFSLGMRQRLQLATALLGDPEILILDEPANGLDPQGIQWLRTFIRHRASLGHAVLVSSHLLSEMEETVDEVVIVSHGRLVLQTTLAELASRGGTHRGLRIRSPELPRLISVLEAIPVGYRQVEPDVIVIDGATPQWFGPLAAQHQIVLYELTPEGGSLEEVFLSLTHGFDAVDPRLAGIQPQPVSGQPQPVGYGPGASMPGGQP